MLEGEPEVLQLIDDDTRAGASNIWHTDVTWRSEPSLGSVLHMLECPSVGGDRLWADMNAAYYDPSQAGAQETQTPFRGELESPFQLVPS